MNENNYEIPASVFVVIIVITIICGIIYYFGSTSEKLENELIKLERLNSQLASETIQLRNELEGHQQRIGSITTGIKDVTIEIGTISNRIGKSQQGVRNLYTEIKETGTDLERAESIINQCEEILKEVTKKR
jgi:chromosome segregation ATPase